ncbi:hypothetical protein ALC60_14251 [Trachymyrmex zeteki]|uniref:GIY-YIG domain-containing protein n=1 Tax=Mycetomoellerius zeteki TaxID=64791 RepID=A0A151WFW7_9HYME|nr:hypothetical protein ALC60_14251 [Trachymyrmex zeteki]
MNSIDYYNKMHEILSDNNTYININKDPTNMMTNQTHTLLTRWKKKRYIDQSTIQSIQIVLKKDRFISGRYLTISYIYLIIQVERIYMKTILAIITSPLILIEKNILITIHKFMNTINTLNRFIKLGKNKLEKMKQCDVIYKISCLDCDSSYVGQTKRKAKTRIKEHKVNINKSKDSLTVLSQHQIDCGHKINWDDIQVLDIEPFFQKRIMSEMIFIKKQIDGLNKQNDTEKLPETYFPLLSIIPPT